MSLISKIVIVLCPLLVALATAQLCVCREKCPPEKCKTSYSPDKFVTTSYYKFFRKTPFEIIDMSFEKLKTVESKIFQGLIVKNLFLGNNYLSKIDTDSFTGISMLKNLHLEHNVIESLQPNSIPATENLYLDYNSIEILDGSMFASISTISILSATNNKIAAISSGTFNNLNMTHLYLSNNRIVTITEGFFAGIQTVLKEIHLDGNGIKMIGDYSIPKAKIVYLNDNFLTSLTAKHFRNIFLLTYVNANNNCLDVNLADKFYQTVNISLKQSNVRCTTTNNFQLMIISILLTILTLLSLVFIIIVANLICKRRNISNVQHVSINFTKPDNNRLECNIKPEPMIYDEVPVNNKPILQYTAEYENYGYLLPIVHKDMSYQKVG